MHWRKIKSAVGFCCFFLLVSCGQPKEIPQINHSLQLENELKSTRSSQLDKQLLTRGIHTKLAFSPFTLENSEQAAFLRDVFEGLTIVDSQGNVQAGVAEKWETGDQKTWYFYLRKEAKWSTGEAITAQDFVESWRHLALVDSDLKYYLSYLNLRNALAVIEGQLPVDKLGISAPNSHTLKISLDKSTPYLPQMLSHIALLPHYHGKHDGFVTNGAYKLINKTDELTSLEKDPFYWNAAKVSFNLVNYQMILPQQSLMQMDIVEKPRLTEKDIKYFPQLCTYFYEFNFDDPFLKQKSIRTALVSMIPSQSLPISESILLKANSSFLPRHMQNRNEETWNTGIVEQLLQQSGISESTPLELKLTYDQSSVHSEVATRLIRMWSQSDLIHIVPDPVSWEQLLEKRMNGDFQLIRSGWCADYNDPSAFLNLLHSKNPDNKMRFANWQIDQLLENTLAKNITAEKRTRIYQDILRIIEQEEVVLPLFQYFKPIYIHSSIRGYHIENPTEIIYSKDLSRIIVN